MQLEQCLVQFIIILQICDIVQNFLLFSYVLAWIPHRAPVAYFVASNLRVNLLFGVWLSGAPHWVHCHASPTYAIVPYSAARQSNQ